MQSVPRHRMQQEGGWWLGRPLMAETHAAALGQTDLREPLCGGAASIPQEILPLSLGRSRCDVRDM